MQTLKAIWH